MKWQKAEAEQQKAEMERQKAEAEQQKAEMERQKAEVENAELKERLRLFQQAQVKPTLGVPEQQGAGSSSTGRPADKELTGGV
ncbi:MAG: hypothetical protein LBU17_04620 [Treponema sp.]|nr:hypothetical protein [Treponema sp.]